MRSWESNRLAKLEVVGHRFKSHSVRYLIVEIECRLCEIGKKKQNVLKKLRQLILSFKDLFCRFVRTCACKKTLAYFKEKTKKQCTRMLCFKDPSRRPK